MSEVDDASSGDEVGKPLLEFLRAFRETTQAGSDDIVGLMSPLLEQVVDTHGHGQVAPLNGIDNLRVSLGHLWYANASTRAPEENIDALRRVQAARVTRALDVTREVRIDESVANETVDATVGEREESPRLAYYPDYVAWEQRLGHHDALTDTFVLGMVMGSLATGLDFTEPQELARFVAARADLSALNSRLSPVIAQLINRMTALERSERPQDLTTVAKALAQYRFQEIDDDIDATPPAGASRRTVLLERLRSRLFEISRRNRLLYFRETGNTANLTVGSVPHVMDVNSIQLEQLLFTNDEFCAALGRERDVRLDRWLRFEDYPFLAASLDKIRLQANRDAREYGFSQLRLVSAFLRWHNLKDAPEERIDSPLILIPVTLRKRKGARDSFELKAESMDAEVNPALRHYLAELYGVRLPETIDARNLVAVKALRDSLAEQLVRVEKGISLPLVETPRVQLMKRKAMRRLDHYRRKLRTTGRGLRSYDGLAYSYASRRHEPLGVQIFARDVRPANAPERDLAESDQRVKVIEHMTSSASVATIERDFYTLDSGEGKGRLDWEVDLTSVVLANFSYRKMTLVRDYAELAGDANGEQANFERLFSETTRPLFAPLSLPPMGERYMVLPTDPSQQAAVLRAREGSSYVIQGPPGTGKSQTITNLIVDYVARGKSVLFVCEKRAALDVVHHRLRQIGLMDACCLIHDAREDKKPFINAVKARYEQAIATQPQTDLAARRKEWLSEINRQIAALRKFSVAMTNPDEQGQRPLRQLLGRWIEGGGQSPSLAARERATLPRWESFEPAAEAAEPLRDILTRDGHEGILARSPMRLLRTDLAARDDCLAFIEEAASRATSALVAVTPAEDAIADLLGRQDLSWSEIEVVIGFARRLSELARAQRLELLDVDHPATLRLQRQLEDLRALEQAHEEASEAARAWDLSLAIPADLDALVATARAKEGRFFAFFSGTWRRAKRLVRQHYEDAEESVSKALVLLQAAQASDSALAVASSELCAELGTDSLADCRALLHEVWHESSNLHALQRDIVRLAAGEADAAGRLLRLVREGRAVGVANEELGRLLCYYGNESRETLCALLQAIAGNIERCGDYADDLARLAHLDDDAQKALRLIDLPFAQLEAAVLDETIRRRLRRRRGVSRFDAQQLGRTVKRLGELTRTGWELNSAYALDVVARNFHANVARANAPMTNTSAGEKDWRRAYTRGRKLLEREFEKSRAYRSVRELFAAESGPVLRDLRPVWLMSPLSVADALPLEEALFDVVIFDEASQIPLEDAVPTVNRAPQMIVVGDEMQLPPTRFFSGRAIAEEDDDDPHLPDAVQFDLNADSFLTRASAALPSTMLAWHYRSKHESLIGFCNRAFYAGGLKTIPTPGSLLPRVPIVVESLDDVRIDRDDLFGRPISFHRLQQSPYSAQRNAGEAIYIALLVRAILLAPEQPTVGIVAFSQAQQSEIESALGRLASEDANFRNGLELEEEREEEDQFVGLFVKNLENVQGDERDIIILSVCYGPNETGRMLMNFGPINQNGGHKRLNVIFSRAKRNMMVVSSISPEQVTNTYNEGANALRQYLRYASAVSVGDETAMLAALNEFGQPRHEVDSSTGAAALQSQIREALQARGFEVETDYGQSELRCHLAVRRAGETAYRLAVLIDDGAHYAVEDIQARYATSVDVLSAFGWTVTYVLGKDWYTDREAVMKTLTELL